MLVIDLNYVLRFFLVVVCQLFVFFFVRVGTVVAMGRSSAELTCSANKQRRERGPT